MKWILLFFVFSFALGVSENSRAAEPVVGHRGNHVSAEGAAVLFVTALIDEDAARIRSASLKPYGPQSLREEYGSRLSEFVAMVEGSGDSHHPPSGAPKRIEKVFAVRPFSRNGPASYGYAAFDFLEVAFVDVVVRRNDDQETLYRMLVVKDRDGLWYVHPFPDLSPQLSFGLDGETPSTVESVEFPAHAN